MSHKLIHRLFAIACCSVWMLGSVGAARGYSTKLHMITGQHIVDLVRKNNCRIPLQEWNQGNLRARASFLIANQGPATHTVELKPAICRVIKKHPQYFLSGTTGPDTFPGMFGNTDPTHALLWNTAWQIQILWQNARTEKEKAFALGWLVHFAGDLNAHGLANLHAGGIWMTGKTLKQKVDTVWKHILTETYYAKYMLPYPKGFPNTLVWPKAFVKKMFFNPNSPLYQHYDYLLTKSPEELGAVAIGFGALYRLMFLLWDFHGRNMHKWRGHKDFYKRCKNKSVAEFFKWLLADQAYNWHKKKLSAIKEVIDRWYTGTHRAQQAIVADENGVFTGDDRDRFSGKKKTYSYDKVYYTPDGRRWVKPMYYKAKGVGGVLAAYGYLKSAIADYLNPDLFTMTPENALILHALKSAAKKGTGPAFSVIEGIKAGLRAVKEGLARIRHAILQLLDQVMKKLEELKGKITRGFMRGLMPAMGKTIEKQQHAFGIVPGRMDTYMNWPIYRNTITAAALMLEKLQNTKKSRGDETQSPVFGLPSGDFGCTSACIAVRQSPKYRRLFMPMAGKYYVRDKISKVFPDYCVWRGHSRRRIGLNETFQGMNNDQANNGFTCFQSSGRGR